MWGHIFRMRALPPTWACSGVAVAGCGAAVEREVSAAGVQQAAEAAGLAAGGSALCGLGLSVGRPHTASASCSGQGRGAQQGPAWVLMCGARRGCLHEAYTGFLWQASAGCCRWNMRLTGSKSTSGLPQAPY